MSLAEEYRRQFGWRAWNVLFDALPIAPGQIVLDLGCGVGDLAAELAARGARVIGIDLNEDLLRAARARHLVGAEFRSGDLRAPLGLEAPIDGLWSSFAAAYFPDLAAVLATWTAPLRPDGWVALTEIDDLFGHEPLSAWARSRLEAYAREALAAGRYDFHMGGKLRGHLELSGFRVVQELTLVDQELSFDGPALPEVIEAWRTRLDRMTLLRERCGREFGPLRDEFLACLEHPDHRSRAKVCACIATRYPART